jgi:hypothetical protein
MLIVLLTALSTSIFAADALPLPAEQAALIAITEGLFDAPPKWEERRGTKTLVWSNENRFIRVDVATEKGHAVAFDSNGVSMTNARLRHLAALTELRELHYGHSGQWHFKDIPMEEFSGAGLEALADSKVEQLKIGGSHFGEAGLLAIAKMRNLKSLDFNHVPVTRAGMEAISRHEGIRSFGVGMMHQTKTRRGEAWPEMIPAIMAFSNLEQLSIREVFLTWDSGLRVISEKGAKLKRVEFGRGSVVFPEDAKRLREALPGAEIVIEPYDRALNGNKHYAERLRALMTAEQFAELKKLAGEYK